MTGTIKRLTDKGFGFIAVEGEEKDIFFHFSGLNGIMFESLNEGDVVNFELESTERGPQAVNISLDA